MNILIVNTKYPQNIFKSLNPFTTPSKFPSKEIILISTLLPITWKRKHLDLNQNKLKKRDLKWADYVFICASEKQRQSTLKTIKKCKSFNCKIIACGSLFTEYFEEFSYIEHLALDDIRKTLPALVNDLENKAPQKIYHSNPLFEIKRIKKPHFSIRHISTEFSENIHLSHA